MHTAADGLHHRYANSGSGEVLYTFLFGSPRMLGESIRFEVWANSILKLLFEIVISIQVKQAIQSAGERMGHTKIKDKQFPSHHIDVVGVSSNSIGEVSLLHCSALCI